MDDINGYETYYLLENVGGINKPYSEKTIKTRKLKRKLRKIIKIVIITIGIIITIHFISKNSIPVVEKNDIPVVEVKNTSIIEEKNIPVVEENNIPIVEENTSIIDEKNGYILTKGKHRYDKYGIDLNVNVLEGMYNIGIDEDPHKNIEEWSLYTPPCPNLRPVQHSDYVINPKCEKSSLQFLNYQDYNSPISLPLNNITNQMEKFKEWKKNFNINPYYGEQTYQQLLGNFYHPYDYGYKGEDSSNIDDTTYYKNLAKSRMDEVPDPRRRRLFSFILFNSEFDLLDLYLSEYYDIVDYFVIYESNSTFSGHPKPLYFTRMLLETDRYDKYKDKLIPVPCEIVVNEDNGRGTAFPKEHLARREVIEIGLQSVHARHGDLFMHGDLDEMPKAHVLSRMKKCGGWEHLQAGIGGAPKSFKYDNVESYLVNKEMNVTTTAKGEYKVNYINEKSLGFQAWSYEYSFNIVDSKDVGTVLHPNLSIFDARRSLGQLPDLDNYNTFNKQKVKRSNYDPLSDPKFNPYQGYTYSVRHTDKKIGKGFLSEYIRFDTSEFEKVAKKTRPVLWNASWHMSSFLPTIDLFYNKIKSYSHYNTFSGNEEKDKQKIINRIKKKIYIFGKPKKYYDNTPILPTSYVDGYDYNFDYSFWSENSKNNTSEFKKYKKMIKHEIPIQIARNPICYSYMLDRKYGFEKELWWQIVPREEWKTTQLKDLNSTTIKTLIPKIIKKHYRSEMLKNMS